MGGFFVKAGGKVVESAGSADVELLQVSGSERERRSLFPAEFSPWENFSEALHFCNVILCVVR